MSYYETAKKALGGRYLVGKEGMNYGNWTPSKYRSVAFLVDGVLVEYHPYHGLVKPVEFFPYDPNMSVAELTAPNAKSPMRLLTNHKAFPMLEEVVIDSRFLTTQNAQRASQNFMSDRMSKVRSNNYRFRAMSMIDHPPPGHEVAEKIHQRGDSQELIFPTILHTGSQQDFGNRDYLNRITLVPKVYKSDLQSAPLYKYFLSLKQSKNPVIARDLENAKYIASLQELYREAKDKIKTQKGQQFLDEKLGVYLKKQGKNLVEDKGQYRLISEFGLAADDDLARWYARTSDPKTSLVPGLEQYLLPNPEMLSEFGEDEDHGFEFVHRYLSNSINKILADEKLIEENLKQIYKNKDKLLTAQVLYDQRQTIREFDPKAWKGYFNYAVSEGAPQDEFDVALASEAETLGEAFDAIKAAPSTTDLEKSVQIIEELRQVSDKEYVRTTMLRCLPVKVDKEDPRLKKRNQLATIRGLSRPMQNIINRYNASENLWGALLDSEEFQKVLKEELFLEDYAGEITPEYIRTWKSTVDRDYILEKTLLG